MPKHGGKFKCISTYVKPTYFKRFSTHGGQFNCTSTHLRPAYFKMFSDHDEHFKRISSNSRPLYFKIFSNRGGKYKCISSHLRPAYFQCFKVCNKFEFLLCIVCSQKHTMKSLEFCSNSMSWHPNFDQGYSILMTYLFMEMFMENECRGLLSTLHKKYFFGQNLLKSPKKISQFVSLFADFS